jgi:thiol:disulfide interchange protein DsbA
LFALFLSVASPLSLTSAHAAPTQGVDYALISPPQAPTQAPAGKVEVIEFFSYGCPHCFHMSPLLAEWKKKDLPANAALIKVPVSFGRPDWGQLVRAYYTLEDTGDLERLDTKLFNAIHVEQKRLGDLDSLTAWAAENGIDANKFRETFNSFDVTTKALRAEKLSRDYKINGVPTITIGGKYRAIGKDFPDMLRITHELVDVAAK